MKIGRICRIALLTLIILTGTIQCGKNESSQPSEKPFVPDSRFNQSLKKDWALAQQYLDARDYIQSFQHYVAINLELLPKLQKHSNIQMTKNKTYGEWHQSIEEEYFPKLTAQFKEELIRLAKGEISFEEIRHIALASKKAGHFEPEQLLLEQIDRIKQIRTNLAENWYRVIILTTPELKSGQPGIQKYEERPQKGKQKQYSKQSWYKDPFFEPPSPYETIIKKAIREKYEDPFFQKKLIFGRAMSEKEEAMTYKTLFIKLTPRMQHYVKSGSLIQKVSAIPESLVVNLSSKGKSAFKTSWETFHSFSLYSGAPKSYQVEYHVLNGISMSLTAKSAQMLKNERSRLENILKQKLNDKLNLLPQFDYFPEKKADELKLIKYGKIIEGDFFALAKFNPSKLNLAMQLLIEKDQNAQHPDIINMLIVLNKQEYTPWILNRIDNLSASDRSVIIKSLTETPWFGDFQIALHLLDQRNQENANLIEAMGPFLDYDRIRNYFYQNYTNIKKGYRTVYLKAFIRMSPPDIAMESPDSWLYDKTIAAEGFREYARRFPIQAVELTFKEYEKVPLIVQQVMVSALKGNYEKNPIRWRFIIQDTLDKCKYRHLEEILNTVEPDLKHPEIWDLVFQTSRYQESLVKKHKILHVLAKHGYRTFPRKSKSLYTQLYRESLDPALNHLITSTLMRSVIKDEDCMREISEIISAEHDNTMLVKSAIQIFSKTSAREYHDYKKNKEFYLIILEVGLNHKDLSIQNDTIKLVKKLIKNGHKEFKPLLEKISERE